MGNNDHQSYFVKFRPSGVEREKEEADKQNQFMNLARVRINKEITNQKTAEYKINQKIIKLLDLDEEIERKTAEIKNLERWALGNIKPSLPVNLVPRTNGFFHLPGKDDPTIIRPDLKRCKKRMIKKGRMDMEYLQQVQEQTLCSKKCSGMTSCGTPGLNDMIVSMEQRIRHGNKKQADEMKIYQEISNFKETKKVYNAVPETDHPYSDLWYTKEWMSKRDINQKRDIDTMITIRLDHIERIKRQQIGHKARITRLKAELGAVRKKISRLEKGHENVSTTSFQAYKRAEKLGEQKKELNSSYSEYHSFTSYAQELARKGDVVELKHECDKQVDGFMRKWNESKAFREDYEKRKFIGI